MSRFFRVVNLPIGVFCMAVGVAMRDPLSVFFGFLILGLYGASQKP